MQVHSEEFSRFSCLSIVRPLQSLDIAANEFVIYASYHYYVFEIEVAASLNCARYARFDRNPRRWSGWGQPLNPDWASRQTSREFRTPCEAQSEFESGRFFERPIDEMCTALAGMKEYKTRMWVGGRYWHNYFAYRVNESLERIGDNCSSRVRLDLTDRQSQLCS